MPIKKYEATQSFAGFITLYKGQTVSLDEAEAASLLKAGYLKEYSGSDSKGGSAGSPGKDGVDGKDGKSAYEIAQANGFTGTETEWLESLKGANGKDADTSKFYTKEEIDALSVGDLNASNVVATTFYFDKSTHTADRGEKVVTNLGTELILRIQNGGAWLTVSYGGENIVKAEQSLSVQYTGGTTNRDIGVAGCKTKTTLYTLIHKDWQDGTNEPELPFEQTNTTSGTDRAAYASAVSTATHMKTSDGGLFRVTSVATRDFNNTEQWTIEADVSSGVGTSVAGFIGGHFTSKLTGVEGVVPCVYKRGSTVSNVKAYQNVLTVYEIKK